MKFINKCVAAVFYLFINVGCTSGYGDYLKNEKLEKDINNTIKTILTEQSNANNVTVYFTYSDDAYFVFVTDHLGTQGYRSKYYFEQFGKQIIIGYKNEELERRFANPKAQKTEVLFDNPGELFNYTSKQVVYKVNYDDTF